MYMFLSTGKTILLEQNQSNEFTFPMKTAKKYKQLDLGKRRFRRNQLDE